LPRLFTDMLVLPAGDLETLYLVRKDGKSGSLRQKGPLRAKDGFR
jgi:hypothetical protein